MTTRVRAGFSLVETLVSLLLLGIILTGVFSVVVQTQRDYTRQRENMRAQQNLRVADVFIRTVLRSALADPLLAGGALIDPDPLNTNNWDNVRVRADFNPADGDFSDPLEDVTMRVLSDTLMVRLQNGGNFLAYAYPVRSLRFNYFNFRGQQITTESSVAGSAKRIRYRLAAVPVPLTPRTATLVARDTIRRETWVYLRNHR